MKILITGVRDVGLIERERIVLRVSADDNVGNYLLASGTSHTDGGVSNVLTPLLWFHDKPVASGDLIVVYSKDGTWKQKVNKDGSTSHFYYLGYSTPLWRERDRAVVLAYIDTWEHYVVPPEEEATQEP